MGGQLGVKETGEGILALLKLGQFVAKRLKDGADLGDALALYKKLTEEGDFKTVVTEGIAGYDKIPAEIGELDMLDALELCKIIPGAITIVAS
jgi:hypothetical protein